MQGGFTLLPRPAFLPWPLRRECLRASGAKGFLRVSSKETIRVTIRIPMIATRFPTTVPKKLCRV